MNLITGTSGQLGHAIAKYYLEKNPNEKLAILSRSAQKVEELTNLGAELRLGDYDNYNSLVNAFSGIETLLLVSSNDLLNREMHHKNAIDAAKEAGVKHIIFTSFQYKSTNEDSPNVLMPVYVKTENYLINSGVNYTILRNGIYTDLLPGYLGENIKENKSVYVPAGNGKAVFTLRNDLAEAAAIVLKSDKYTNAILDLTNIEAVGFAEITNILSSIFNSEINYIDPNADEYKQVLVATQLPEEVIGLLTGITASIKVNEFDKITSDLETILQRKPTSVVEFLNSFYN